MEFDKLPALNYTFFFQHGFDYRDNSPEQDSENGDEDEDQSNLQIVA